MHRHHTRTALGLCVWTQTKRKGGSVKGLVTGRKSKRCTDSAPKTEAIMQNTTHLQRENKSHFWSLSSGIANPE